MPCRDDWGPPDPFQAGLQKRLDAATKAACSAFKTIELMITIKLDGDETLKDLGVPDEDIAWWTKHQEADAKRKERLREQALAKLSKEEREALDL